jgi:hypothetical protein
VTADEAQKALENALIDGSGLRSVGGPTFEEMEAEYRASEKRRRSEEQAEPSAVVGELQTPGPFRSNCSLPIPPGESSDR